MKINIKDYEILRTCACLRGPKTKIIAIEGYYDRRFSESRARITCGIIGDPDYRFVVNIHLPYGQQAANEYRDIKKALEEQ